MRTTASPLTSSMVAARSRTTTGMPCDAFGTILNRLAQTARQEIPGGASARTARKPTAFSHCQATTDCGILDREELCGNIYFNSDDATYSLACCWSRCCFVPTSPSASCRPAARRFSWNSVPRTGCLSRRTICTTTIRSIMRICKIVRSGVRPLKVRFLTSWSSILPGKYLSSKPFSPNPSRL